MASRLRVLVGTALVTLQSFVPTMVGTRQGTVETARVSLLSPRSRDTVKCWTNAAGLVQFAVRGSSQEVTNQSMQLLIWVRPVRPAGEGWYLQRPPLSGIQNVDERGNWTGLAQIGNLQYPPHNRDIIEVAITVMRAVEAGRLLNEPGVVVRGQPLGIASDRATSIVVALPPQ